MKKTHTIYFPNKIDAIEVASYLMNNEVPFSYANTDCKCAITFSNENDYLAVIKYSMKIGR